MESCTQEQCSQSKRVQHPFPGERSHCQEGWGVTAGHVLQALLLLWLLQQGTKLYLSPAKQTTTKYIDQSDVSLHVSGLIHTDVQLMQFLIS